MFSLYSKLHTKKENGGFTLIEMMVSVGIFAMITTIVMVSGRNFNGSVLLTNLAYDVALSIRTAQSYSINVKSDQGSFSSGYGMRFVRSSTTYTLFADRNGDNRYQSGEEIETYTMGRGNTIQKICGNQGGTDCDMPTSVVDIAFHRPDPDATMTRGNGAVYTNTEIHLQSPKGETRIVKIESTGQISIQTP